MKKLLLILILVLFATPALADVWVNGYTKSNGTYVQGHYRSSPNNSRFDNYSTKGNVNPYTGKKGYVDPYKTYDYKVKPYNPYKSIYGN